MGNQKRENSSISVSFSLFFFSVIFFLFLFQFEKVDDLARLDVPLFGRKSDVKQIFGFIEMLLKEGESDRGTQTSLVLTGGPGVGSYHLNFLIEIINTQATKKKKFPPPLPYRQDSFLCGTEEGAYFVFERHQPARFSQTL